MPVSSLRKLIVCGGVAVMLLPAVADAQYVSRSPSGGLHVSAPGVNVNVPPIDALAARGNAGGRRFFGRRRALNQQAQANQQANGQQPAVQATPQSGAMVPDLAQPRASIEVATKPAVPSLNTVVEDPKAFPTPEKLAIMDAATLQATLRDVSSRLHVRLSNLETGAGWQKYLNIPGVLLDAPTQNGAVLKKTLARYDSVAGNPIYAKLAGMPSFIATGATLRQLTAVAEVPQLNILGSTGGASAKQQAIGAEEILPTPADPAQPNATRGERSILKRASR